MKAILGIFAFLLLFRPCLAKIFINEVAPAASPEWVELYSDTADASLDGYTIYFQDDLSTTQKMALSGNFSGFFRVVTLNNSWLNNDGDTVILWKDAEEDRVVYWNNQQKLASFGRSPDASGNLISFAAATEGQPNPTPTETPILTPTAIVTPTPVASATPTAVPSPTSTIATSATPTPKATCRINQPHDAGGNALSSVQIYVDGTYIHHEDEETLTFCSGCECYSGVACGFGQHTITLKKSGFQDWSQTISIDAGDSLTFDPVLTAQPSGTPSPVPTATMTATPRPTATISTVPTTTRSVTPTSRLSTTPTKKQTPTPSTTLMAAGASSTPAGELTLASAGEVMGETKEAGGSGRKNGSGGKIIAISLVLLGGGLVAAAFLLPRQKDGDSATMEIHEEEG